MASQQDPTNNNQAEEPKQETFKDRLDRAATESRSKSPQESTPNPIVEKITEFVPAAANFLPGAKKEEEPTAPKPELSGPPHRPDHDNHIEEFVREQHRSKGGDAIMSEAQSSV